MNKIVVVIVCAVFLTVGRVWAQEAKPLANPAVGGVPSHEAAVAGPSDNAENETVVNDEGYGADDEEYYGGEEEAAPAPSNTAQPVSSNAVTGGANAVQTVPSNAESK